MPDNLNDGNFFASIKFDYSHALGVSLEMSDNEDVLIDFESDLFLLRLLYHWLSESNKPECDFYLDSFLGAFYLCLSRLYYRCDQLKTITFSEK